MKTYWALAPLLCSLLFLSTCASGSEDDKLYQEAFEKQAQVLEQLELVRDLSDAQTKSDSLALVIHEIEESIFPIPGHSLHLPGHEDHDHGHGRVELTASEVLAIQKDLLLQLQEIKSLLTYDK